MNNFFIDFHEHCCSLVQIFLGILVFACPYWISAFLKRHSKIPFFSVRIQIKIVLSVAFEDPMAL